MGVGTKLIQKVIQDAKDLGLHKVSLKLPNDPSEPNLEEITKKLRKFYESLGFIYWGKMLNSEFMYMLI